MTEAIARFTIVHSRENINDMLLTSVVSLRKALDKIKTPDD